MLHAARLHMTTQESDNRSSRCGHLSSLGVFKRELHPGNLTVRSSSSVVPVRSTQKLQFAAVKLVVNTPGVAITVLWFRMDFVQHKSPLR